MADVDDDGAFILRQCGDRLDPFIEGSFSRYVADPERFDDQELAAGRRGESERSQFDETDVLRETMESRGLVVSTREHSLPANLYFESERGQWVEVGTFEGVEGRGGHFSSTIPAE